MAFIENKDKGAPPFNPLFGFIVLLVLGVLAFLFSPQMIRILSTTNLKLGGLVQLLPMSFPTEWSFLTQRLVITFGIFIGLFIIFMIIWSIFMAGTGREEGDMDLAKLRKEKEKARKRR